MAHVEDRWFRRVGRELVPTARHGKGLRYRARWTDPDGRERSESFPDKRKGDAEKYLIQVAADMLRGTYLDPDAGKLTLNLYAAQWRASRSWDASTRQTMSHRLDKHVLPKLGDKRLDQLARSPSIISGWLAGLPVGAVYAGQLLDLLSSVLGAAVDDGRISRNPCRLASVKAPRVTRRKLTPWTAVQVAAVRAAVPARYQAVVDCGSGLGQRQGEIFGLPLPAVNWLRRSVRVRIQVRIVGNRPVFAPPKGGRERDVPLPESVSLALAAHLEQFPARRVTLPWLEPGGRPHAEELIFTTVTGRAVNRTRFNDEIWRPSRKAAGLPNLRENGMHALRHYYASVLLAGGVDIEALSEYLGHHDPGFTLRTYAHLRPSAEGRALRAVEAALAADRAVPPVASSDTTGVSSET
jgi:integrase